MRDIRLVFQSFLCMSNTQPRTHQARSPSQSLMPAQSNQTNWPWQHWWNISEGEREKNTGLENWINIINHRQESAINGVCFLLETEHRREPCAGMVMGIIWPVLWPQLSSARPDAGVHRRVHSRVHSTRCQPPRNQNNTVSYLSVSVKATVDGTTCLQVQLQRWGCQSRAEQQRGVTANFGTVLYILGECVCILVCTLLCFRHSIRVGFWRADDMRFYPFENMRSHPSFEQGCLDSCQCCSSFLLILSSVTLSCIWPAITDFCWPLGGSENKL